MMDIFMVQQVSIVLAFLAALFALLIFVKRNRSGLAQVFSDGKRMEVSEIQSLGPNMRAVLLRVDQREILIISGRGIQPEVTLLGPVPEAPL